jgi:pyruvate/2-oxoglutarate dehydrogenase complex dihydrolipoamide dehydrogenase (E3) component
VVGAGYISVELAGILHGLGAEVSVLMRRKDLLLIENLSIYQNRSGHLSIDLNHLAFRSFQPRHNSRHNKKEASETARSARFAAPNNSYSRESQPKDSIRTS